MTNTISVIHIQVIVYENLENKDTIWCLLWDIASNIEKVYNIKWESISFIIKRCVEYMPSFELWLTDLKMKLQCPLNFTCLTSVMVGKYFLLLSKSPSLLRVIRSSMYLQVILHMQQQSSDCTAIHVRWL